MSTDFNTFQKDACISSIFEHTLFVLSETFGTIHGSPWTAEFEATIDSKRMKADGEAQYWTARVLSELEPYVREAVLRRFPEDDCPELGDGQSDQGKYL